MENERGFVKMDEEVEEKAEDIKKPDRKDFLKEAREIAERNEKAVEDMRQLVERQEDVAAKNILGGKSEAGQVEEKHEETPTEYKDRIEREAASVNSA